MQPRKVEFTIVADAPPEGARCSGGKWVEVTRDIGYFIDCQYAHYLCQQKPVVCIRTTTSANGRSYSNARCYCIEHIPVKHIDRGLKLIADPDLGPELRERKPK